MDNAEIITTGLLLMVLIAGVVGYIIGSSNNSGELCLTPHQQFLAMKQYDDLYYENLLCQDTLLALDYEKYSTEFNRMIEAFE